MKTYIIQAAYPTEQADKKTTFESILSCLESVKEDSDLVLLPEYSNTPGVSTLEQMTYDANKNTVTLQNEVISLAKKSNTLVAVNMAYKTDEGFRNSTLLYDRTGKEVFRYDKQHLSYEEHEILKLDYSYKNRVNPVCFFDIDGIRLGFLTCYDTYFLEYIEYMASKKPDVILISSYQRSENPDIILSQARIIASRCNCPVLRASYSMGQSATGGHSLVCGSDGTIISDMEQREGILATDIDLHKKTFRSNGHKQKMIAADEFIDQGRTPSSYRAAGSFIALNDEETAYPRLCAHRGFSVLLPENTIISLASAIALDTQEIEFDLWTSKDNRLIATHDNLIERDSDKKVYEYTYDEIMEFDASDAMNPSLEGLKFATFEEILEKFNHQTIMNIHIKSVSLNGKIQHPYDEQAFKRIADLIELYGCEKYVYISGDEAVLTTAIKIAPHLTRCCLAGQKDYTIVDKAIEFGCKKLQFHKPWFTQQMIEKAHANNIRCNVFWSDDPTEALEFLEMGMDTILTNNLLLVQRELKK